MQTENEVNQIIDRYTGKVEELKIKTLKRKLHDLLDPIVEEINDKKRKKVNEKKQKILNHLFEFMKTQQYTYKECEDVIYKIKSNSKYPPYKLYEYIKSEY